MKVGLVADIIVAILIIINLIICTKRGFIRCVMATFSTILALAVAILVASPLAHAFDSNWGWIAAIEKWNVPFVSAETLLKLFVGIAVFVVVRLLCILVDKLLQLLKEKLKAVNIVDRILGTVFGAVMALFELTIIFVVIDTLNWTSALSLTEEGGGYFAWRLFDFCHKYIFNILTHLFGAAAAATPKI